MTPKPKIERYGAKWNPNSTDLQIELSCVQNGGRWPYKKKEGHAGMGLYYHIKRVQEMLWPEEGWHRWKELLLSKFCEHKIVGVMGPASSGKTHEAALYALVRYFASPKDTAVLVSSTDSRSLELRVWGEIKKYWSKARKINPGLAGNLLEAKQSIATDSTEDDGVRDLRNGIIGIPCMVGGSFVGLSKYVGVKQSGSMILIADECQFMQPAFLDAISNLGKNPGFQCIALGNPKDRIDVLGKICEPSDEVGGWDGVDQSTEKTKTWPTRFQNGICVQLVGTDSPNFDFPESERPRYPYIITREAIKNDEAFYGRESFQFSMMNLGMMPKESSSRRVITRSLCDQFNAFDDVCWNDTKQTKIFAVDAAYGSVGGDRCVGGEVQFGYDVRGRQTLAFVDQPIIIPVSGKLPQVPEDQIACYVRDECRNRGIEPENVFYDSTGRGSLGLAFARNWEVIRNGNPHPAIVNAVDFGGKASDRTISQNDQRLCCNVYSKFVTELWFMVRLIIEADQFRRLPQSIMEEGCLREWKMVAGNKIEIEPKAETKKRMGRSPDLFDMLVTAVEGARQKGFKISRIGTPSSVRNSSTFWSDMKERNRRLTAGHTLKYTA